MSKATNMRKEVCKIAIDPVCKMDVDPKTAATKTEYKGETYYFGAPGCKVAFERDPEKYVQAPHTHGGGSHRHHGH